MTTPQHLKDKIKLATASVRRVIQIRTGTRTSLTPSVGSKPVLSQRR